MDEPPDSPTRVSMRRRRKSSNFDMLAEPFRYQDYVKKFLDGIEEEEDFKHQNHNPRKRTRSSNFLGRVPNLPEIDEEDYDYHKEPNFNKNIQPIPN